MGNPGRPETGPANGYAFPRPLFAQLQSAAPKGSRLRLALWNGEVVIAKQVLRESDDGLLVESDGPDGETGICAVAWSGLARVETAPGTRRGRAGFLPSTGT